MPAQPSWHARVPEVLATLRAAGSPPFLDRPAIEQLFGLRRRQAIRLMGGCGGYLVGKTFLVGRENLALYLDELTRTGVVTRARRRKQRIGAALDEAASHSAARRIGIHSRPGLLSARPADLSPAIEVVAPGKLQITYAGAGDLLARIAELAAAATNDFPRFREIFEGRE